MLTVKKGPEEMRRVINLKNEAQTNQKGYWLKRHRQGEGKFQRGEQKISPNWTGGRVKFEETEDRHE